MRALVACLGVAVVALVAAFPAAGKEGVKATLTTRVPLAAPAGTTLRVAWTLTYRDEHGRRRPFGGEGIFIRLLSASGGPSKTAFARGTAGGYTAIVRVPDGGIRTIQIGIEGWSSGPNGTRRADELSPITNAPKRR
ncbi:MAG: hypothetical protein ACXVZN_09820 [Gaiellaceae bacterium]